MVCVKEECAMKIKEVEKLVQMNTQTIRYYEKLGLLNPGRDENGYRNYTLEDAKILKRIRFLRELDISLDLIRVILDNPNEFQNIIDKHIQLMKGQISNLEKIERRCEVINKRNLPLLDTIVDGEYDNVFEEKNSIMKEVFLKAKHYSQPFSCITLGHKTTPFEMIKKLMIILLVCALISFFIMAFIYVENGLLSYVLLGITIVLVFVVFVGTIREKYVEFRDNDFYVFNSFRQNKFRVVKAILNNSTLDYAQHYYYSEINKVEIQVVKKYSAVACWGVEKTFSIIFNFEMKDGHTVEINSSLFKNNKNRKTVLDILDYHNILIVDKYNFREGIEQENESLYAYLDKNV